jgi:hypothetical protein
VEVGAQSDVVGEIPAFVVGVIVDHDVVAVPIPVVAVGEVKWGDAEVEAAKPETAGIATLNAPPVSAAKTALKMAVLPGMIEVKAPVVTTTFVTNPFPVVVDVGGFGVIVTVAIRVPVVVFVAVAIMPVTLVRVDMIGRGTMVGNVSAADIVVAVVSVVVVFLRQGRQGKDQGDNKNSEEQFHGGTSNAYVTTATRVFGVTWR